METNGETSTSWSNLPSKLEEKGAVTALNKLFTTDPQYLAFTSTNAITHPITFGIKSSSSDATILITFSNGKGHAEIASDHSAALFTLCATPEQWEHHFQRTPKPPYHTYYGIYRLNMKPGGSGVGVLGSSEDFARYAHVWRRSLELLHDAYCGPLLEDNDDNDGDDDDDHITGRYITVTAPVWGKCKLFVEYSGTSIDKPIILFLHTAGADSRQYHAVMNDSRMRDLCDMYAFDLPGHGRSFPPGNGYHPGVYTNTEDAYVGCIGAVIEKLRLKGKRPIVCGASMAGQVCLAVAIRAAEVGAGGSIPLEGSEYTNMNRQWYDRSPTVNQSLFNPEYIYGMMGPTAPAANKALIWHLYSAQAYGIFHGDLDFYFGGWDGRNRVETIDTKVCPVYMLNGEYDWSNTPEMSQKTADKIPGAKYKTMEGLGHFPATENPKKFVPYLIEAVEWILKRREEWAFRLG